MTDITDISVAECWHQLFHTRIAAARCRSRLDGKNVILPRRFVRQAASLDVEFTVHWAWLLPVLRAPAIRVVCTDDNGQLLAEGVFPDSTLRTTRVRLSIPNSATLDNQRLHVQVTRLSPAEEIGKIVFIATTPANAARSMQALKSQVVAMHEDERIVCDRLHDGIAQFGFNLTLRLFDANERSLLTQLGAEVRVTVQGCNPEEWIANLGRTPIRFIGTDVNWVEIFGPPKVRLPKIPGNYRMCFLVGGVVVATQPFSINTFQSAVAAAQAAVTMNSEVTAVDLSAVKPRKLTVPLRVVAEDFETLNACVTLAVPQPDPLVKETRHGLDLVLYRDGRELSREHRRVALKPGRRRSTLSLSLSSGIFTTGPGIYRLGVWLDDRQLHTATFEHKTRAQLKQEQAEAILQSLRLAEPRWFSVRDGVRVESPDVFVTDTAMAPTFCISGEGFDEDAQALQWRLTLRWRHLDSDEELEEQRTLIARAGINPCTDLELPLRRPKRDFRPGRYTLQLSKRDQRLHEFQFRILSVDEIIPYTEQIILRNLRAESPRLLVRAANTLYQSKYVPDSADGILPELTVHSSGYNRFVSELRSSLRIVFAREDESVELASLPIALSAQPLTIENILIKVRNGSIGATNGPATLFIFIGEHKVTTFPFQVVTREDILNEAKVAIRVEAEPVGGGTARAVSSLDLREHRAFSIALEIQAGIPAPGVEFAACTLLRTEHTPLGRAQFELSLAQTRTLIRGRPIQLSRLGLAETSTPQRLTIEVLIGGELKGSSSLTVITSQRITDFEGQLTVDPASLHVDDAEYQAILNRL